MLVSDVFTAGLARSGRDDWRDHDRDRGHHHWRGHWEWRRDRWGHRNRFWRWDD